ncbi:O-antigen ligase family protein [Novosphingobium jiangmenense]|uniref:O-antigen ligase family protein n=1 Tax=Novosphingobium jiangmenense TaxID=2791981 RepID=A0ABS0HLP0_9SPHN|nr:O-antigen ligase family protein [Novosphingobium jiangmenense]MBF9153043.1 O-antigen ligase family protein [Novosphingobium jiangmenense]
MTLTPMATAPAASGPASTDRPVRQRLTMQERRQAWARHREAMTRLVTGKIDWIPVLVFASILMSPEARIDLSGFQLFPYRIALIVSLPFVAVEAIRRPIRPSLADILFLAATAWMFMATASHYAIDIAFKTGGSTTLDTLAAYLVGRIFFREPLDLRRFLYRVTPFLVAVAILMFLESVSHRYLVRTFIGSLTGFSPQSTIQRVYELRFGLLRAMGPFLHPIAAGLFFGSLVPLFLAADLPKRRWLGLLACAGGFFAWSSAGVATILAGLALGFYDYVQRRLRWGWFPLIMAVVVSLGMIESFTSDGIVKFLIRNASFNPQTGYFRLAIWEYGSADVARSPWIGIGILNDYTRPKWMHSDSVDNYWLLLALRYGIPCSLAMLAAVALNVLKLSLAGKFMENGALHGRRMATGLAISVFVLYVVLITVSPWGADMSWLIMLLGMAGGLADRRRGGKDELPAPSRARAAR